MPVAGEVPGFGGRPQVALPADRDELGGGIGGDLAGSGGVELAQHLNRGHQRFGTWAAGEPHRREHRRGELAHIGHRVVQHAQMPVIAWKAFAAGGPGRAQPVHPDLLPHQDPDVLIGDVGVQGDHENLIQQCLAVLPTSSALGQLLSQTRLGGRFPP